MDVARVRGDLIAEQDDLDAIVSGLNSGQWALATPSPRWTVAHQIAHLTYFDQAAATAITDPATFATMAAALAAAAAGGDQAVDEFTLAPYLSLPPAGLLAAWREGRETLAAAAQSLSEETRVNWYGPSMGSKSFLTARLMETWAHGQDVIDALGATREATDRLRHIAQLGFITRGWSYLNRGEQPPEEPVRMVLTAPSGAMWEFGPADATERVTGPAEELCLVVVQRRHLDDTSLVATPLGRDWLLKAQAFAGPPTPGPAAGTRG